jgi:Double-GTPase 2
VTGGFDEGPDAFSALPDEDADDTLETERYRWIRCPLCLGRFRWDGRTVYDRSGHEDVAYDLADITDSLLRAERSAYASVLCTAPVASPDDLHFLPINYVRYGDPLVVGFVGTGDTGKSTLLAAMIREIDRVGLARFGLSAEPLDRALHDRFERERIEPLFGEGRTLTATPPALQGVSFVDAYLLEHAGVMRPVAFFDVGGESLSRDYSAGIRFLHAVGALVFVADPQVIDGSREVDGTPGKDTSFQSVLDTITRVRRDQGLGPIAAAVVVAKADMRRFDPAVERWLNREPVGGLDPDLVRAESRDVFAYLYEQRAVGWLYPVSRCEPCTLHFVSATGGSAHTQDTGTDGERGSGYYPRGVRPRRVLEPLAAILAMTGFIDVPGVQRLGR